MTIERRSAAPSSAESSDSEEREHPRRGNDVGLEGHRSVELIVEAQKAAGCLHSAIPLNQRPCIARRSEGRQHIPTRDLTNRTKRQIASELASERERRDRIELDRTGSGGKQEVERTDAIERDLRRGGVLDPVHRRVKDLAIVGVANRRDRVVAVEGVARESRGSRTGLGEVDQCRIRSARDDDGGRKRKE